jgi:(E)-4-hydroxy-3-methylbut-2-enyl-diphosphate synthase
VHSLTDKEITNPVIIFHYATLPASQKEDYQIAASADLGPLLMDGLSDGIYLHDQGTISPTVITETAFSILQAARLRTTRTEYIACPGCGRTLYNLEETLARIKAATAQYKGLKIAVMGCIVNGPGEMADADYGYVGAARGKVSLYKKKVCIEKNIPEDQAVARLLQFISENEPQQP